MLSKRSVCPDPVRLNGILNDDLTVYALVSVGQARGIEVQETFIDADAGYVEQVRASEDTDPIDVVVEGPVATTGYVCTVAMLVVCEFRGDE